MSKIQEFFNSKVMYSKLSELKASSASITLRKSGFRV